ncbi:MAG: VOC family protein [Armatimonadota bacterium]|nr:VOC family protein [Armatimonadota bacterium]MDR7485671.1 VOC family protein [Armatimonadota bacterium]MDR7533064.1 VOC family protein [Armatimonadota bacterium]MDR7535904.1 VOC family protein [Armatimonadota bacterium]
MADSGRGGARPPGGEQPAGLTHLLLQVRDLAAAEEFFVSLLGFTVRERATLRDGRPLVALAEGLGLTVLPAGRGPGVPAVDHVAFRVADLAAVRARLEAAGLPYEGPVITPRYGTSIYVRDPDGTRIELHDR